MNCLIVAVVFIAESVMEDTGILLPNDILASGTPSRRDGISEVDERRHRSFGCAMIHQAGQILEIPQVAVVTSQNIFHRFYYRKSLTKFDVFSVAMGCTMLGSKVEEALNPLRDLIFVFHFIYLRRKLKPMQLMELGGMQYATWKNELIAMERIILKELGFSLYHTMDHPHKYILYFVKLLEGDKELARIAWSFLNDSMHIDACLRYTAQTVACAAILFAAEKTSFSLPSLPWWKAMGAENSKMRAIIHEMKDCYDQPQIDWLDPLCDAPHLSEDLCVYQVSPTMSAEPPVVGKVSASKPTDAHVDYSSAGSTPKMVHSSDCANVDLHKNIQHDKKILEGSSLIGESAADGLTPCYEQSTTESHIESREIKSSKHGGRESRKRSRSSEGARERESRYRRSDRDGYSRRSRNTDRHDDYNRRHDDYHSSSSDSISKNRDRDRRRNRSLSADRKYDHYRHRRNDDYDRDYRKHRDNTRDSYSKRFRRSRSRSSDRKYSSRR